MNPGPAPRPPTDRPKLNLMPSTAGIPGNMSQLSLQSPSVRSFGESSTNLSRATTLNEFNETQGTGGVAILKEGSARIKEGLLWKTRWLVLRAFQLDFQKNQGGKVSSFIPLKDVTAVGRSENTRLAFEITRLANSTSNSAKDSPSANRDLPQRTTLVQLESDDEIYEWIDAIYNRCPGMGGVSNPTNFAHRVHVGFDPVNGAFVGLPTEWERLLTASAITKDDYKKHPEAVIEVLEFYSDITKRKDHPDVYPSLTPTPPVMTGKDMQLGHGGGGTAVAPPRPAPPSAAGASSFSSQRSPQDSSSSSRNGTPAGQRNISNPEQNKKLAMDNEMRRAMEEEARKVKANQEKRDRDRYIGEEDPSRREQEAYNASIPKAKTSLAKQELGGYGNPSDESPRYNPTRQAPVAPSPDRPRQQPQGSLRGPTAHRPPPQAPPSMNGNVQAAPKPPYAQKQPSSRDQSPGEQRSLRAPQKPDQHRQPSPNTRIPVNVANHKEIPTSNPRANGTRANPATRDQNQHRPPGSSNQQSHPAVKQPAGAPSVKRDDAGDAHKQTEQALTKGAGATRQKEVRMSSMTESQVMEKLKQVVSKDDPSLSYSKQKKIGQGASGSVYVAKINENAVSSVARRIYKTQGGKSQVAIKQMDLRNQPRKELIVNEIIVMKESSHPNIVNFLDSFLQESNNELWVVMEFMEGGALTDVIDNNPHITEAQISTICNEVDDFHCSQR